MIIIKMKFFLKILIFDLFSFSHSIKCKDGSFCPGNQTCCMTIYKAEVATMKMLFALKMELIVVHKDLFIEKIYA